MRTHGFATFFLISLSLHLTGAIAFMINSEIRRPQREVELSKLPATQPEILQATLYPEIDLTMKTLEEEAPANTKTISWKSSKAHLPPSSNPLDSPKKRERDLAKGVPRKTKSSPNRPTPSLPADRTGNDTQAMRPSKKGSLAGNNTASLPPQNSEPPGNTPYIRDNSEEESQSSHDDELISLETKRVEFMEYFQRIQQKINEAWEYPAEAMMNGDSGNSEINFEIGNDGTISRALVFNSSGSVTLDEGSVKAILAAAPFPPIPLEIRRSRLNIVATFRYSMNFGAGNQH